MTLGILTALMTLTICLVGYWTQKIMTSGNKLKGVCTAFYMIISSIILLMILLTTMLGLKVCKTMSFFSYTTLLSTLYILPLFYSLFYTFCYGKKITTKMYWHFAVPFIYSTISMGLILYESYFTSPALKNIVQLYCISGYNIFIGLQVVYYLTTMSIILYNYKHVMSNFYSDKTNTDYTLVLVTTRLYTCVFIIVISILSIRMSTIYGSLPISIFYSILFILIIASFGYVISHIKCYGLPDAEGMEIKDMTLEQIEALEAKYDSLDAIRESQKMSVNIGDTIDQWINDKNKPYLRSKLTINDVSEEMHIPLKILSSYLNTTLGMNFNTWINTHRIGHVKLLLLTTDMTLDEISAECGFTDRSALSRIFRSMEGLTPSEYKRENLELK